MVAKTSALSILVSLELASSLLLNPPLRRLEEKRQMIFNSSFCRPFSVTRDSY